MDSVETEQGISRRTLLKRVGAGAAIAWAAPIVTTFGSKAFAGLPGRCLPPCDVIVICAVNRPTETGSNLCACSADTEGRCACWADIFCDNTTTCASTADCPAGWRCIPGTGCGDNVCIPKCGQTTSKPARSGKTAYRVA